MMDFIAATPVAAPNQSLDSDSRNTAPCPAAALSPLTLVIPHPLRRRLEYRDVTVGEVEGEGVLVAEVGRGPGGRVVERPTRNDRRCHGGIVELPGYRSLVSDQPLRFETSLVSDQPPRWSGGLCSGQASRRSDGLCRGQVLLPRPDLVSDQPPRILPVLTYFSVLRSVIS